MNVESPDEFDSSIDRIVEQVRKSAVVTEAPRSQQAHDADATKAELQRLREDLDAATARSKPIDLRHSVYDTTQPAVVPQQVPQLPKDFRETDAIKELRRLLTSVPAGSGTTQKIGFHGMGGIGKTVASAALLRDASVREYYDQIIFLPLGQTPVMEKIRSQMYLQLTGMELKIDWTEDQKIEEIRKATAGRKILLYLDDIWDDKHAQHLSLCDPASRSAVLISTRMRGLCGSNSVEIKPPDEEEGIAILIAAAGLPKGHHAPPDAAEIVRLCGNLPLSLSMAGKLIRDLGIGSDWHGVTVRLPPCPCKFIQHPLSPYLVCVPPPCF